MSGCLELGLLISGLPGTPLPTDSASLTGWNSRDRSRRKYGKGAPSPQTFMQHPIPYPGTLLKARSWLSQATTAPRTAPVTWEEKPGADQPQKKTGRARSLARRAWGPGDILGSGGAGSCRPERMQLGLRLHSFPQNRVLSCLQGKEYSHVSKKKPQPPDQRVCVSGLEHTCLPTSSEDLGATPAAARTTISFLETGCSAATSTALGGTAEGTDRPPAQAG